MSGTLRWWHKSKNVFIHEKRSGGCTPLYASINPFYFRHEYKLIRVKIHRALRRNNKIRLQKGFEIEPEQKTNGWITH
jgi:hypothetical protein